MGFDITRDPSTACQILGLYIKGSVYFTENSGYRSLKNRSCVTVFGSCSATLTVGEPLGDVSGSANHHFRTSVTGISGEIDASYIKLERFFINLIGCVCGVESKVIQLSRMTCLISMNLST